MTARFRKSFVPTVQRIISNMCYRQSSSHTELSAFHTTALVVSQYCVFIFSVVHFFVMDCNRLSYL